MSQVSHEYCEGIREGRVYLKEYSPNKAEMIEILDNLNTTIKRFSAGPVKEMLKGERDFFKHQIKKGR